MKKIEKSNNKNTEYQKFREKVAVSGWDCDKITCTQAYTLKGGAEKKNEREVIEHKEWKREREREREVSAYKEWKKKEWKRKIEK